MAKLHPCCLNLLFRLNLKVALEMLEPLVLFMPPLTAPLSASGWSVCSCPVEGTQQSVSLCWKAWRWKADASKLWKLDRSGRTVLAAENGSVPSPL